MKPSILISLKKIVPARLVAIMHQYYTTTYGHQKNLLHQLADIVNITCKHKFILPSKKIKLPIAVAYQFKELIELINFNRVQTKTYFYPLDRKLIRVTPEKYQNLVSLTLDYNKVLKLNLLQLRDRLILNEDDFSQSLVVTIDAIEILRTKTVTFYSKQKDDRSATLCSYMHNITTQEPQSFDEAMQKILFYNALLWFNQQRHIGLGRLDLILYPYYQKDLQSGKITKKLSKEHLQNFILTLAHDTKYKSGVLIGDTGQVVFISGIDYKGEYVENELSHLFLEVITELNIPDPKLILRANRLTTDSLWLKAIDCLSKGNGSPLIANEDKIIDLMSQFGYETEDCINWGTSACWEPLIIGKSFDQNNRAKNISLINPLLDLINQDNDIDTYIEFEEKYINQLKIYIQEIALKYKVIQFEPCPLHSIWIDGCVEQLQDISEGGAKYNYHGFLAVGLPNIVNSLLNIEDFIYTQNIINLSECKQILATNYIDREDIRVLFEDNPSKFGDTSDRVLKLTNRIMQTVSDVVSQSTINGQKAKVGFSSPAYIDAAKYLQATPDGRKQGEPFGVHISPVSQNIDIAEIIQFASLLDYSGNKINGNVLDFVVTESFIKNRDKFASILKSAIKLGVYEVQLNVLSVEKLIAAKANPKLYPNLVVRVWGFSAYFNDLPEEYQDHLIRRAQMYA